MSGIFQIHFSQNRFHFRAKDFHSYEIIGLKFQKRKKVNPGSNSKIDIFILGKFSRIYRGNKNWISEIEIDVN